jgi:hypothetical protein
MQQAPTVRHSSGKGKQKAAPSPPSPITVYKILSKDAKDVSKRDEDLIGRIESLATPELGKSLQTFVKKQREAISKGESATSLLEMYFKEQLQIVAKKKHSKRLLTILYQGFHKKMRLNALDKNGIRGCKSDRRRFLESTTSRSGNHHSLLAFPLPLQPPLAFLPSLGRRLRNSSASPLR